MKVYNKIVIDLGGVVVEADFEEYDGPVALAGGGSAKSGSEQSYLFPELQDSLVAASRRGIIDRIADPNWVPSQSQYYTSAYPRAATNQIKGIATQAELASLPDINTRNAVNAINGQYTARGLGNSGISMAGAQNAITELALKEEQQATNNLTNLVAAGSGSTSKQTQPTGMSVVCGELNRQGFLDDVTWEADCSYARLVPIDAIRGYHLVAKPIVRAMQRWHWATVMTMPIAIPWAKAMRHRVLGDCPDNFIGRMLLKFGVPLMAFIGRVGHGDR